MVLTHQISGDLLARTLTQYYNGHVKKVCGEATLICTATQESQRLQE